MDTILIDRQLYYLPTSITDVQALITKARKKNCKLRVRGAYHSVPQAIEPGRGETGGEENLFVLLSKMNGVKIDAAAGTAVVEAGCHLGLDPFDPTGISTWENSLFCRLDGAGFAVPDMGGIIHQTVGGFLSTGSSGGSTQYSLWDALESITFLPADQDYPQPLTVSKSDPDPAMRDLFYAAGVSMGLLGVVVSVTFSLIPRFAVRGQEAIRSIADCPIDMSGSGAEGKISLSEFLDQTPYTRLLWYPQPGISRVTVWQAARTEIPPDGSFKPKPYKEFDPILGTSWIPQLLAGMVYTGIGRWPRWLGNILGTNTSLYQLANGWVSQNYYSKIFPQILPQFVKESAQPQEFQDYWYAGLPMDNQVGDQLFPVEFTELWIPMQAEDGTDNVAAVMKELNDLFTAFYSQASPPVADGSFCVELYAARATEFWMSPAYQKTVFRVDVFWFKNNNTSPVAAYYPLFWKALAPFGFRPHWGKYLPPADSAQGPSYLQQQYPRWNDFLALREKFDPKNVFLSPYWQGHLGLGVSPTQNAPAALPVLTLQPDANGYYHPDTWQEVGMLVRQALSTRCKLRVRGAGQSVSGSIHTDGFQAVDELIQTQDINLMLDQMQTVTIDEKTKQVVVQAGCHLGFDPYDPTGVSTEENSLFFQLRQSGLAIPNVADEIRQTVGGFLSTSSSAGSLSHSFLDAVLSLVLIDGEGKRREFKRPDPDNPDDPFYGVVVSMGLMGIITEVTLQCVDAFNVIGRQTVTNDDRAPLQLFSQASSPEAGSGVLPDLQTFLRTTEFTRLIWWPYPSVKRLVTWQARTMQAGDYNEQTGPPDNFQPKPYEDAFYPSFLPKNIDPAIKAPIEVLTELTVSGIFSVIGTWPYLISRFGKGVKIFGKSPAEIQAAAEQAWPGFFPKLLNVFLPCDKADPQQFWDNWVDGLNNDKTEYSNNLLPAYRTEFWVPVERAAEVMTVLEDYYRFQYFPNSNPANQNTINSCYVIEILGAKSNPFWLSPAYEQDSLRVNFYSLKKNNDDVIDYFQQFWDLFFVNQIDFRLHWGYVLPRPQSAEGTAYLGKQYPRWKDFQKLREELDPHQVFVTDYWRQQLGIPEPTQPTETWKPLLTTTNEIR